MQKLFSDTRCLDKLAEEKFSLTEEILMENAATGLENSVRDAAENLRPGFDSVSVLVVTGSGGNGADGYALARRLNGSGFFSNVLLRKICFTVSVFEAKPAKTPLCKKQKERALACGVRICQEMEPAHILVDCLFGSGFSGFPDESTAFYMERMNSLKTPEGDKTFVIACDVPSGIQLCRETGDSSGGTNPAVCVSADVTVCMGALKLCLFTDEAVDFTGKIITADLGIPRHLYESGGIIPDAFLVEAKDMVLPHRKKRNVHKGTFGHAAVFCGGKPGAGIMAASASAAFGAGLTTLVFTGTGDSNHSGRFLIPPDLMVSESFPENCTALAAGMGLAGGEEIFRRIADILSSRRELPAVLDADFFYWRELPELLRTCKNRLILTPHPKELAFLLENCGIKDSQISVGNGCSFRFSRVRAFCEKFPGIVLLSKGTVSITGFCPEQGERAVLYINSGGSPALAKGGSGDILSGLICALLAQRYKPLEAALTGTLAHATASRNILTEWGLSSALLIESVRNLHISEKL